MIFGTVIYNSLEQRQSKSQPSDFFLPFQGDASSKDFKVEKPVPQATTNKRMWAFLVNQCKSFGNYIPSNFYTTYSQWCSLYCHFTFCNGVTSEFLMLSGKSSSSCDSLWKEMFFPALAHCILQICSWKIGNFYHPVLPWALYADVCV